MARAGERLAQSFGVLLLLSLPQAASGLPHRHSAELSPDGRDAYILSQGLNTYSANCSVQALEGVRDSLSGSFLWVRRTGRVFTIRDPQTLDGARALFAPLRELEPEQQALSRKQERLDSEEQELDSQQDDIDQELDRLSDEEEHGERAASARRELERRKRDLEPKLRDVQTKQRDLEAVERSLDAREDALEKKIEAELWRLIDEAIKSGVARPDENR